MQALASDALAPRERYVVSLSDPPVALYQGGAVAKDGRALAPTAIEKTGAARLDADSPAVLRYVSHLDTRRDLVLDRAEAKANRALTPDLVYRYASNGFALSLTLDEAAALAAMPGVSAVTPDWYETPQTDAGPSLIGAESIWNGAVAGIAATRGEGIVIGIIDTGINWNHPSFAAQANDGYAHTNPLGRFFGLCASAPARCNAKLIGVYDFTNEGARDGSDANGHGSHVAATAAGNRIDSNINAGPQLLPVTVSGVAPRAAIISYKACQRDDSGQSPSGTCPGSATLAAIDQAVRDGVSVINYSIGGAPRDPWIEIRSNSQSSTRALLAARAAGVFPAVAAGNEGPAPGTVTSPGNAPWVIAVANATHDRVFGTRLSGLTGPTLPPGSEMLGAGLSAGIGPRRVVYAGDFGNALCGTGASQGVNPTGASNPFAAGTFNGEIVVCDRGIYARVEKGFNVRAAGAGGYVLANTAADGESIVADTHFLPTVHLGFADGTRLLAAIAAARAAGSEVRAAITATERLVGPRFGDVLASSSGRGPVQPFGGWLKPNLTAPGTNILAAAGTGNGLASLSGTSMASPHVAGAAALLLALDRNASVSGIESALLTTTSPSVRASDGVSLATPYEAGAGRVNLVDAARAPLYLPMTVADYVAADPIANGSDAPLRLNHPSLLDPECLGTCRLTRRVVNRGAAATWRLEARLPSGALLAGNGQTLSLGTGESRELTFDLDVSANALTGTWIFGEIALVPVNAAGNLAAQRLPVAVFASPGAIPPTLTIEAGSTHGYRDIELANFAALPDAGFIAGSLTRVDEQSATVAVDPTPNDAYDNPAASSHVRTFALVGDPRGPVRYSVIVETASFGASRADLFVGSDDNDDGVPQSGEQLCAQTGAGSGKRCEFDLVVAASEPVRRMWAMAQNRSAAASAPANISISVVGVPKEGPPPPRVGSLVASGPGQVAANAPFTMRLGWSVPDMLPGDRWLGFVDYLAQPGGAPIGRTLVTVRATGSMALGAIALGLGKA